MLGLSAELHLLRVQAAGSLLSADFEADPIGSIPNGWKASGGSWSVAVDGTQVVSQTASGASNLVAGSGAWKDYAVAADVKQPFILNASFGIEGRYQTANNGYVLLLSQQQWKLCKNSLGWFTVLASGPFAYSAGTWYRLGLTFAGAAISASINGQTIAMVSDAKFATGSIGLRATGLTEFDNVVVTAVSPGPPTAALTVSPSSGTAPLAVTADASASSTPPGTAITAYEFDFGDGVKAGPQAGAIATHQYMAVGSVGLTVTVTNSAGQTSSATAPVSVRAGPPVAALKVNPDVGPAPLAVNADASLSTTPTGTTITGYTFDFGDGLPAAPQTGSASSHQYSSPGSYVAGVTVTNSAGLSSTASAVVSVSAPEPPFAAVSVTPGTGIVPLTVTADASASTTQLGTTITGYTFSFGDGTPAFQQSSQVASHQYLATGKYAITVRVSNSAGMSSTAGATADAVPPVAPIAALSVSPTAGLAPLAIVADASASTTPSGSTITTYSFQFGDGTSTGPQPGSTAAHTYVTAGSYMVTVTITSSSNLSSTESVAVKAAWPPPIAVVVVTPSSGVVPLAVVADASGSTTAAGTTVSTYLFDFGDGTVGEPQGGSASSHQYVNAGTFTVRVLVTNSAGLSSSAGAPITATASVPRAALTVNPSGGLVPLTIAADASASAAGAGTTVTGYTFDFGDGSITAGPQPAATSTHVYTAVGTFSATITLTNSAGQSSSAAVAVTVTGVAISQQVRSGVINGPPNNQVESDFNWVDPVTRNGWQVGIVPGYGGANVSFWSQIDGGIAKPSQTALNTTTPSGLFHDLTNRNSVYTGSEDAPFNIQELAPAGTAFRRAYVASAPRTGKDANGFQHRVTTYIYPGDPGFLIERYDLINPSAAAITLSSPNSIEWAFIGGLQQVDTTWRWANGRYGYVGGAVGSWPSTETSGEPDYYYINPAATSATKLGLLAVRKTSLAAIGATNRKFVSLQNSHRLKIKSQGSLASFPPNTTLTLYLAQALRRDLTAADSASIASDYLNPDVPLMSSGVFNGFSYDEGAYEFTSTSGGGIQFSPSLVAPVTARWLDVYRIAGWNSSLPIRVTVGSVQLQPGVDYISLADSVSHIAYVKLMKPLVGAPSGLNQLALGTITISG